MNITVTFSDNSVPHEMRNYAEEKMQTLEKVIGESSALVMVHVELAKDHNHEHHADDLFRAEVRISGGGYDQYVVAKRPDIHQAIDAVRDEAFKVLARSKDKKVSFVRRGRSFIKKMFRME